MDALLSDPRFTLAVVTAFVGVIVWIAKDHARRLKTLEREAVRKEDLKLLRDDLQRDHNENRGKLENIEEAVTGTHRRIDDLYRDLIGGKNS